MDELYRRYAPLVYRRSLAILADEQEALDAVQDVFLSLMRSWPKFRGDSGPVSWLYRVTTNHCLNRIRARGVRRRAAGEMRERLRPTDPHEPALRHERRDLVEHLLRLFDDRVVQIVLHRYQDGMTQAQIAELVGISDRAVRKNLKKFADVACRQLQEWEAALEEEP